MLKTDKRNPGEKGYPAEPDPRPGDRMHPQFHPLEATGNKMHDYLSVEQVEVLTDGAGKVWINVNGVCIFRAGHAMDIRMEVAGKTVYARGP